MSERDYRNARVNYLTGIALALLSASVMAVERIVLVSRMNIVYAGLNSLFENTFLILSAFDIGVTTYLMNYLLTAVSGSDEDEIRSCLRTVGHYCRLSALIILTLGLAVSLLMPLLSGERNWKVALFFLIYLSGQLGQYLFGSRVLLLSAMQRNYVVSIFVHTGRIVQELLLIAVIIRTENFLLYVSALSLLTFVTYLFIYLKAGRDYPFVSKRDGRRGCGQLPGRSLLAMSFHRSSYVFYRSLEPVLVSFLFGSAVAGLYSNYLLLTSAFLTPFWIYSSTVTPTITLRYLRGTRDENLALYKKNVYLNFILSLSAAVTALSLYTPYITLFFGREYLLPSGYDAVFAFLVFLSSFRTTALAFRDAAGIYTRDWKKALFEVLAALVLSLVLSRLMGLIGIPVAFTASYILVVLWRENRTVLRGAFYEEKWDFCAREAALMAYGMITIVAVWYVTEGNLSFMRIPCALGLLAAALALWLLLSPSVRRTLCGRNAG